MSMKRSSMPSPPRPPARALPCAAPLARSELRATLGFHATSTRAGMGAVPGRSSRRNTIPVPVGAGRTPVCRADRDGAPPCTGSSPATVRRSPLNEVADDVVGEFAGRALPRSTGRRSPGFDGPRPSARAITSPAPCATTVREAAGYATAGLTAACARNCSLCGRAG